MNSHQFTSIIKNVTLDEALIEAIRTTVVANKYVAYEFLNIDFSKKQLTCLLPIFAESEFVQSLIFNNCRLPAFRLSGKILKSFLLNNNFVFLGGLTVPAELQTKMALNEKVAQEAVEALTNDFRQRKMSCSTKFLTEVREYLPRIFTCAYEQAKFEAMEQLQFYCGAPALTYPSLKTQIDAVLPIRTSLEATTTSKKGCCVIL